MTTYCYYTGHEVPVTLTAPRATAGLASSHRSRVISLCSHPPPTASIASRAAYSARDAMMPREDTPPRRTSPAAVGQTGLGLGRVVTVETRARRKAATNPWRRIQYKQQNGELDPTDAGVFRYPPRPLWRANQPKRCSSNLTCSAHVS